MIMALSPSCAKVMTQQGKASYYADKFKGRRTASGEKFRQHKRTAASLTIPLGTKVRVTNLENGKSVKVRINDRGPYVKGRILDLSKKAARRIDMLREGVVPVRLRYKLKKNHR
jgi:rare lipoprotein A